MPNPKPKAPPAHALAGTYADSTYRPATRVRIASGRFVGRYGCIVQPPGTAWPDANGQIGIALEAIARSAYRAAKPPETKYFGPSQIVLL